MVGTERGHQRTDRLKPQSQTTSQSVTGTTALSNSMKLNNFVWGTYKTDGSWWRSLAGEGNGKPLQYSCHENPMFSMMRGEERTVKDELPRLVGAQYAVGDQWRHDSRNNEGKQPKQRQHTVVDWTADRRKIQCCREQYCIGTWIVRSMNQGKLESVKQKMSRMNINILGISKLKWTGMGEINSDDHYIYY